MDTKEGDTANAAGNTRQAAQEVQATAKKGAGRHDHEGRMNAIPNFQQYFDGLAQIGTCAGALDILVFANLEDKRIRVHHDDGRVFDCHEMGKGDAQGFYFYSTGHYEIYDDIDELEWSGAACGVSEFDSSHGHATNSTSKLAAAAVCGLSEFASSANRAESCKYVKEAQQQVLMDFASASSVGHDKNVKSKGGVKRPAPSTTGTTARGTEAAETDPRPSSIIDRLLEVQNAQAVERQPPVVLRRRDVPPRGAQLGHQWPCNICRFLSVAETSYKLTITRENHILCRHRDVPRDQIATIRKMALPGDCRQKEFHSTWRAVTVWRVTHSQARFFMFQRS
ncbi:unnamed protein product [Symbiodinium microadriaticum]|nr:unnamed protein product [Symbiodinium microadriaticum]CAE7851066.1 unnamed protein product [Symbiodinium sp. KB8]